MKPVDNVKAGGDRVQRIDVALQRYYRSLNVTYNNQFAKFCRLNGFVKDELQDELDEDKSNCMLPGAFDDDNGFPFSDEYKEKQENEKHEFIYNLIKKCATNPNVQFLNGTEIVKFTKKEEKDHGDEESKKESLLKYQDAVKSQAKKDSATKPQAPSKKQASAPKATEAASPPSPGQKVAASADDGD